MGIGVFAVNVTFLNVGYLSLVDLLIWKFEDVFACGWPSAYEVAAVLANLNDKAIII